MSIIWCCRYSLNFTTHPSFDAHFIPSAISFEALFSDNLRIDLTCARLFLILLLGEKQGMKRLDSGLRQNGKVIWIG